MGGSAQRGWGPLAGSVDIQVTDSAGERISAIKLTLTATHVTTIPKSASADAPSALDRMAIDPEETKTKEITLLHIERFLFAPNKTETDRDANLLPPGKHAFPFSIDLPLLGNKDKKNSQLLPPSCVIEPLLAGPNDAKLRSSSSLMFGRSKANGKDQTRLAWATVKYQLKLTVQRPGLLKRNLRCYAPFVYLPSPPSSSTSLLLQRRALGAQMAAIVLQRQGDGLQAVETPIEWRQRRLPFLMSPNEQRVEAEKKTGFLSSLFSGSRKPSTVKWHEAWSFSMPMTGRSAFPLRSAIPFIVRCMTNKPVDLSLRSPLAFRLYRRVRFLSGRKQKAIALQQEPVAEAALRYSVESRGVYRLNGVISLPPNCVPNFDLHSLSLDYYVAVVRLLDGAVLHKEYVTLACPPPVEPKTAYGPFPSGAAWRIAQEPPPQQDMVDENPSLARKPSALTATMTPALSARQRPNATSIASSSSSSFPATSRRPSMTPSAKSHRSASTDSAHQAIATSLPSQGNTSAAASAIPMGLAGMVGPPPASSAGASGLGFSQSSDYLNPVREQRRTSTSARTGPSATLREPRTRRPSHGEGVIGIKETGDAASITSGRRRERYSSRGAAPVSAASSVRSSVEPDHRPDANRYVHTHEKAPLASIARKDPQSASRASSSERGSGRPVVLVTSTDNLPSIPAAAAASSREQANALVGASSSPSKLREKRAGPEQRGSSSSRPPPVSVGTTSRNDLGTAVAPPIQARRSERPLPVVRLEQVDGTGPLSPPSPPPLPHHSTMDPALFLTNDDLMYGEDMELDLPPSYFEAVYGAEDDDDDGADEAHR